ncbi:MAG: hypothetical protein GEV04_21365 [Actinophytocola sp.]|nr:hypothetical protein [Actinophytocola sp.]
MACEELLAREPTAVPALARRAVELITRALMYMDDSSGVVGDDLHAMMSVHAKACAVAPPDPKRLAAWLAKLRLDGPGWPDFELRDYAAALGEKGRHELARIVEARAATAEPDPLGGAPFGIRILREQLAEISGDVDHYVAVLANDLRGAWQYRKIVNALRDAGRPADAEAWAKHGLAEVGNPIDMDKLRDVYVDLLLERRAGEEALTVRRTTFDRNPTDTHYLQLRDTARRLDCWQNLHKTAVGRVRDAIDTNPAYAHHLISILLDEDEPNAAWQTAVEYADAIGEHRWHELIELRQTTHPADVIEPWQTLIEQRLGTTRDKYRYGRAIKMLRRLRDAYRAVGNPDGFQTYLGELRDRHRRKTSFIAKLDRARL